MPDTEKPFDWIAALAVLATWLDSENCRKMVEKMKADSLRVTIIKDSKFANITIYILFTKDGFVRGEVHALDDFVGNEPEVSISGVGVDEVAELLASREEYKTAKALKLWLDSLNTEEHGKPFFQYAD